MIRIVDVLLGNPLRIDELPEAGRFPRSLHPPVTNNGWIE